MKCFRFIWAERAHFPISLLCRVLGVSRSGFHAWLSRPPSNRELADACLCEQVREIHAQSRGTYGAPRVHAELRFRGVRIGRKRVERRMHAVGVSGLVKRKRGRTTIAVPGVRVADDLVERDFNPPAADLLWVADITYARTWEGWLYVAVCLDCFSRRVVGFAIADHLRAELVVDALEQALVRRRPGAGLIHHSDQGSQYVSLAFGQECRRNGIALSMGSKGDCYDTQMMMAPVALRFAA